MKQIIRKIKNGWDILKHKGVMAFIAAPLGQIKVVFRSIYLSINKKSCARRLSQFSSEKPEEVFDFISKKFFDAFAPMQIREEFLQLLDIFQKVKPKVIMEIGTANGGTLFCFSKLAVDDATIISVDLPEGKFGGGYPDWKMPLYQAFAKNGQDLHLLREDSHLPETLEKVKKILAGRQVDFLFIDSDHSYEGVKKDFEMYNSLVRNGGIIAFHDITPNGLPELTGGVPQFWKEIKNKYQFKEFVKDYKQTGFGIGVLFV
jgi:predicted O-methyltransferase YrrM